ncbi:MAG: hypothetical protein KAU94_03015, partial [Verrucomicrobia bacterium]|nr:hypothetical protein [Verrucomicrobiota bacterium]
AILFALTTVHGAVTYNFDDGTMQGWVNTVEGGVASNPSHFSAREDQGRGGGHSPTYSLLHDGDGTWLDGRDAAHDTLVVSSPAFTLAGTEEISFYLLGGTGDTSATPTSRETLPTTSANPGIMGVALRRVSDGAYLLYDHRDTGNQYSNWEKQGWTTNEVAAAIAGDAPGETYQLDYIDQQDTSWGWTILDTVSIAAPVNSYTWVGGDDAWDNAASWDVGMVPGLNPIDKPVTIATGVASIGSIGSIDINVDSLLTISGNGGINKTGTGGYNTINAGGLVDLQGGATIWTNSRFYIKGTTENGSGELRISGGNNLFSSSGYFSVGRQTDGIGLLTISGGDTTVSAGTAAIFGGYQGDGQVDMTGGTLTIAGPLWIADQGDALINHSGGDFVADDIFMGNNNGNGATDSYYNLSGTADLYLNGGLTLGNGTQTPENNVFTMDGGTMSVTGITQVAGEFVFNEGKLTLRDTDVSDTILGETWFIEAAGTTAFFDGTDTIVASASATEPATIVGISYISGSNTMRMVIDAPSALVNYHPLGTANLVVPAWTGVPHSDDGVNAFMVTDLSYSTTDGSNVVIYVEANDAVQFFGIGQ